MAIFTPGIAVGQISGRVGGSVFSHNRGGMYVRNGSIPSISQTNKAMRYKSYLALASQLFANLTDAQAAAWREYAANHPVTNRLGRTHTLSAGNWFVACNARLIAANASNIDLPPNAPSPTGTLITAAGVKVAGAVCTLTLTADPSGANSHVWIRGARVQSGRITNVKNKLTEILITAVNEASPIDISAELIAELGSLQAGDWYHFEVRLLDTNTGLISAASTYAVQSIA
jgi:hypothetical protein